ncbi:MAG: hypothetical protein RLY78_172 [Pseudomonadota bacterium]
MNDTRATPAAEHPRPIVWSIAGTDSGGGAGLAADQRAAEACGVHLCPVVAAVTAQHTAAVTHIAPVDPALLQAQLDALAQDLPPRVIKTGLLGGPQQVRVVAAMVRRLRAQGPGPVALVVDPVLGASSGAGFADAATLQAYRDELLPLTTVLTPNRAEAQRLLGDDAAEAGGTAGDGTSGGTAGGVAGDATGHAIAPAHLPALARRLRALGVETVVITGGDAPLETADRRPDADAPPTGTRRAPAATTPVGLTGDADPAPAIPPLACDWLDSPQAAGWMVAPRIDTPHTHGTGCTYASALAGALAHGFVSADAAVLAKMVTTGALRAGRAGLSHGAGPHPVRATAEAVADPTLLPWLGWDEDLDALRALLAAPVPPASARRLDLYALSDDAAHLRALLAAGVRTLQLRIKTPATPDAGWPQRLRTTLADGIQACRAAGAELFINDHGALAAELGADGVHLGQEDLQALGTAGRAALRASGVGLGISSHALWELCRARTLAPRYIACGPVWPTLTKAMPWHAQGLRNLAWWVRMAGAPVVAIGGILDEAQARAAAAAGADGVCVVRAVAGDAIGRVPAFDTALRTGRRTAPDAALAEPVPPMGADRRQAPHGWPLPSLAGPAAA